MPLTGVVSTSLTPLGLAIVVYGPPETTDLLTLYDAAPAVAAHDNDTWALPATAARLIGAGGGGDIGLALTSKEFGPSPTRLTADTT